MSLHTESDIFACVFFVFVILKIHHAQKPCTLSLMRINQLKKKKKEFAKRHKMSSSIKDDFVFSLLKKKKGKKEIIYWVHPILKYREDWEFTLLKEHRDYHSQLKVYFRMSVAQFEALPAILEPHIKKTTNFCELSVQGSICALCCEMKWMNLKQTLNIKANNKMKNVHSLPESYILQALLTNCFEL